MELAQLSLHDKKKRQLKAYSPSCLGLDDKINNTGISADQYEAEARRWLVGLSIMTGNRLKDVAWPRPKYKISPTGTSKSQ